MTRLTKIPHGARRDLAFYDDGFEHGVRSVLERLTSDKDVHLAVVTALGYRRHSEHLWWLGDEQVVKFARAFAAALSSPIESETRDGD